jgi:hypothetical protein
MPTTAHHLRMFKEAKERLRIAVEATRAQSGIVTSLLHGISLKAGNPTHRKYGSLIH